MKKLVALLLAVMLIVPSAIALGESSDGKVLNIYCWNDEFKTRFEKFYQGPESVTVNWVTTPSQDNAYQNALDAALLNQDAAAADEKVDMFLVEADYALKYCNSPYTLDVYGTVGLAEEDTKDMYQYTKDIMTADGVLKGVSWQACPAGMIYRRSFAKEVLGTDDPAEVQQMVSDWDKFDAMAAKMKEGGYFMVSGYDDDFSIFSDNMSGPWVKDGMVQRDASIEKWIEQTKLYTDNGYNNKASLWSPESMAGAGPDGKVFCYFGPSWFIDFSIGGWSLADANAAKEAGNGTFGDWAFCQGPQGFSWGGTWICAAAGTDNLDLVKDIMFKMTCEKETLVAIAQEYSDFTNSVPAMEEMAASDYNCAFLGGQNYLGLMLENAKGISRANITGYDQTCREQIQAAMKDYYDGNVDLETAWDNFYTAVEEKHPELTH